MLTFARLFADSLRQGESPETASLRLGISDRTARLYFNGTSLPTTTKYRSLAESLGLDPAVLAKVVDADRRRRARPLQAKRALKQTRGRHSARNVTGVAPSSSVSPAKADA